MDRAGVRVMNDIKAMLQDIRRTVEEDGCVLTEGEEKFIESIRGLSAQGRALSPKRDEVFEKIWKKVTGL